jgi:hypothetical protein
MCYCCPSSRGDNALRLIRHVRQDESTRDPQEVEAERTPSRQLTHGDAKTSSVQNTACAIHPATAADPTALLHGELLDTCAAEPGLDPLTVDFDDELPDWNVPLVGLDAEAHIAAGQHDWIRDGCGRGACAAAHPAVAANMPPPTRIAVRLRMRMLAPLVYQQ